MAEADGTFEVVLTDTARGQFDQLPVVVRDRVAGVFDRLRRWPEVSGAKPLRGRLKGHWRVRTGDWRVVFRVAEAERLIRVTRVDNRRDVYED